MNERLKEILGQVAEKVGAETENKLIPDHVRFVVEIPPPVGLSRFVQLVKGRSKRAA